MANNRGGLSKREFEAKSKGQPMPYASKSVAKTTSKSSSKSSSKEDSKISKQLEAAQKALEATYEPTSEEKATEQGINDLSTQTLASVNKIKADPIAQGFQTGQIRETERASEEKSVPLKLQIATLQARRQAASNLASSKVSFATDQYNRNVAKKAAAAKSTAIADDPEYKQLQKDKLKAEVSKLNKPKATGSSSSDWQKVTTEKGPTGRVRSIIERNKKTGETRRTNVK